MLTASERIGQFVATVRPHDLPDDIVENVALRFVDTFAVAIAGSGEAASRITREYVRSAGVSGGSSIWGTRESACPEGAALANSVAGHALDYDDVAFPLTGHPSVVLLPALISLGEAGEATGEDVAAGYYVGYEVAQKVGRVIAATHYARGWHCTATIGVIGAAAACSHLLRLDAEESAAAIGIAAAQVAGVRRSFGTMAKPLQAGNAAAAGVRAARLAALGMTAPLDALDGPSGFVDVYGGGEDLGAELERLGESPGELVSNGVFVKKYPCCYDTQRAIEAALELVRERPIDPQDIRAVRVRVHPTGLTALMHSRPETGLEGKFSLEYTVSAAVHDRAVGLGTFTDDAVRRPTIQALLRKVERSEDEGDVPPHRAVVEVALADGERCIARVEELPGSPQLPLSVAELDAKVRDCASYAGRGLNARELIGVAQDWRHRPISALVAAATVR